MPPISEVLVATTLPTEGDVAVIRAQTRPDSIFRIVVRNDLVMDEVYHTQIKTAEAYLTAFLEIHPFSRLVAEPLRTATIELTIDTKAELSGHSHGLAVLLVSLSSLLELPPRDNIVFSAGLAPFDHAQQRIVLESVAGIPAKTLAVGEHNAGRLYYHSRREEEDTDSEDREITDHLRRFHLGDADHPCEPVLLPQTLSWENLFNVGIDLSTLWTRARDGAVDGNLHLQVIQRILHAALLHRATEDEFPVGVGAVVATLRKQEMCPADLPEVVGIIALSGFCLDEHLGELLKIAISEDASRSPAEDLAIWVGDNNSNSDATLEKTPLSRALWLLDIGCYTGWLEEPLPHKLCQRLSRRMEDLANQLIRSVEPLSQIGFAMSVLQQFRSDQSELIRSIVQNFGGRFDSYPPGIQRKLGELLNTLIRRTTGPGALLSTGDVDLTLLFGAKRATTAYPVCPRCHRSLFDTRLNDLDVTYDCLEANPTLPSPVLLLETAASSGRYSQRRGYRLAEDTLAQLPRQEEIAISGRFNEVPARIEFNLRRAPKDKPVPIGILWDHNAIGFPPAIDSQFFVSALERWRHTQECPDIGTAIDVGCGTGYLAAAATYLFPSMKEITLVDMDALTVHYAAANIRSALKQYDEEASQYVYRDPAPETKLQTWAGDFVQFQEEEKYDLMLCNPPYLPQLELASTNIGRATQGTRLLEAVASRATGMARRTMMVFSALAWPEFERALMAGDHIPSRIVIFERQLVPLRVAPIQPIYPEEQQQEMHEIEANEQFVQRVDYYRSCLRPRGLIDLDLDEYPWEREVRNRALNCQVRGLRGLEEKLVPVEDRSGLTVDSTEDRLRRLRESSRGFRFWHETRVIMIET